MAVTGAEVAGASEDEAKVFVPLKFESLQRDLRLDLVQALTKPLEH